MSDTVNILSHITCPLISNNNDDGNTAIIHTICSIIHIF